MLLRPRASRGREPTRPAGCCALDLRQVFLLLSDPTRLHLLLELRAGERCVGELTAAVRLPQPAVSHHLMILRETGVAAGRRNGKWVFYSLGVGVTAERAGQLAFQCADGVMLHISETLCDSAS